MTSSLMTSMSPSTAPPSPVQEVVQRLTAWPGWRDGRIVVAGLFVLAVLTFAVLTPYFGVSPTAIDADWPLSPPGTPGHLWGTDDLGRDLMGRLAIGAQISLALGLATAVVSVAVGTAYGIVSAYAGRWIDTVMMRLVDVIYSLPGLMVVILLSVYLDPLITQGLAAIPGFNTPGLGRLMSIVLALSLFSWPDTARIIRGQVMSLKQEEFVEAYHSMGGPLPRLIWAHLLPNLAGFILLTLTITVPRAILTESTLSFIGLGVEPPLSSWGTMASDGWQLVRVAPYLLLFPATAIFSTMVALNVLGDGLRASFNPKDHS